MQTPGLEGSFGAPVSWLTIMLVRIQTGENHYIDRAQIFLSRGMSLTWGL